MLILNTAQSYTYVMQVSGGGTFFLRSLLWHLAPAVEIVLNINMKNILFTTGNTEGKLIVKLLSVYLP